MSAGYTPGPWRTEIDNVFAGPESVSIYVADCAPMGGPVDGTPVGIANARLIAAAPELFEALERCRARLLVVGQIGTKDEDALNMALVALNKARGETQ